MTLKNWRFVYELGKWRSFFYPWQGKLPVRKSGKFHYLNMLSFSFLSLSLLDFTINAGLPARR